MGCSRYPECDFIKKDGASEWSKFLEETNKPLDRVTFLLAKLNLRVISAIGAILVIVIIVVVVNAEKVVLTGKKETDKQYMTYSQYPGKEKRFSPKDLRAKHPEDLINRAVRGMIPHNRLGRAMITKLKVYRGAVHPHAAQKPEALAV